MFCLMIDIKEILAHREPLSTQEIKSTLADRGIARTNEEIEQALVHLLMRNKIEMIQTTIELDSRLKKCTTKYRIK
jgi:hypothetical protein